MLRKIPSTLPGLLSLMMFLLKFCLEIYLYIVCLRYVSIYNKRVSSSSLSTGNYVSVVVTCGYVAFCKQKF